MVIMSAREVLEGRRLSSSCSDVGRALASELATGAGADDDDAELILSIWIVSHRSSEAD